MIPRLISRLLEPVPSHRPGLLAGFGSNPGGGGRVYLTKPAFPFIEENISGEIRDKWPLVEFTAKPDQGPWVSDLESSYEWL